MTKKPKTKKKSLVFNPDDIKDYLKGKKMIFDIGSGPNGSDWWKYIDDDAQIVGIDTLFFPKRLPKNVKIYKYSAMHLQDYQNGELIERHKPGLLKRNAQEPTYWEDQFDMVVANHVLEHVESPEAVIEGMGKLVKKGGIVYTGFPDGKNFTDTFYHVIHAEGGGHVRRLSKETIEHLFKKYHFGVEKCVDWPDDWLWFQKLYDFKGRKLVYITQEDIDFMANVFRKELTPEKGYFYGWEMVFQKK